MKLPFILMCTAVLIASTLSCKKRKIHPVPNIPFDITININLPTYSDLLGVGGSAFVQGGSKGLILYRRNIHEIIAFDLHSPANDGNCADPLEVNGSNSLQLIDQCDGAVFNLLDGSPISGSDVGLRMYITQFDGQSYVRIYN